MSTKEDTGHLPTLQNKYTSSESSPSLRISEDTLYYPVESITIVTGALEQLQDVYKQKLYDLELVYVIRTLKSSQDLQDMRKLNLLSMETPKIWSRHMKL